MSVGKLNENYFKKEKQKPVENMSKTFFQSSSMLRELLVYSSIFYVRYVFAIQVYSKSSVPFPTTVIPRRFKRFALFSFFKRLWNALLQKYPGMLDIKRKETSSPKALIASHSFQTKESVKAGESLWSRSRLQPEDLRIHKERLRSTLQAPAYCCQYSRRSRPVPKQFVR